MRQHIMQVYYEIETQISSNHQLNIQLPDTIPAGRAKVAVIYEVAELPTTKKETALTLGNVISGKQQIRILYCAYKR